VLLEPITVPLLPPPPPMPMPRASGGSASATQAAMRCQRQTYSLQPPASRMHPQGRVSCSPPRVVMQAAASNFSSWQFGTMPLHATSYQPEQLAHQQPQRHLAYSPPPRQLPRQWQQVSASSRLPSPVAPQRWTYVSPRRSAPAPSMPNVAHPGPAHQGCRARGRHSSFEPRMPANQPGLCAPAPFAGQQSLPGSMLCPSPGSAWSGSILCPAPPPALSRVLGLSSGSAAYPPGPQVRT
ncbi:unnamed protein product, partial [Symbiodinium pilosum]